MNKEYGWILVIFHPLIRMDVPWSPSLSPSFLRLQAVIPEALLGYLPQGYNRGLRGAIPANPEICWWKQGDNFEFEM